MGKKDPRVDAYIARSPQFARPILTRLRSRRPGLPGRRRDDQMERAALRLRGADVRDASFKAPSASFMFWKEQRRS